MNSINFLKIKTIPRLNILLFFTAIYSLIYSSNILTVCLCANPIKTQTSTLVGVVYQGKKNCDPDPYNIPLQEVTITITNKKTRVSRSVRTNQYGKYRIENVLAGDYEIIAKIDDFDYDQCFKNSKQFKILTNYPVNIDQQRTVIPPPIYLIPVKPSPSPEPPQGGTGSASQKNIPTQINLNSFYIETNRSDATLRGILQLDFITALPLKGVRSFDKFALLVPGVAPAPSVLATTGPSIGPSLGTSGEFSVNGQRSRNNNFTIDGSDNNDQDIGIRRQGFTTLVPQTIESVLEFEVSTLLADAEAGRNTGGQVNIVSQYGENKFHGQLYDFIIDSSLNARDFFELKIPNNPSKAKQPFTLNQLGGVISLPLAKDKGFFFGAVERQDLNRTQQLHFAVPTLEQRQRALSRKIVVSQIGKDVLDLFPLPNNPQGPYGSNTLTENLDASGIGNVFSLRFDYNLSKNSLAFIRYNLTDDDSSIPAIDNSINSSLKALSRTQNLAFTLHTQFSNNVFNEARFSFGRTSFNFTETPSSPFTFQSRSFGGDINGNGIADSLTGPIGRLIVSPFSSIGIDPFSFPQKRANNTFQLADTYVITKGIDALKFGFDVRRTQFNSQLERNYRAQLAYNSNIINIGGRNLIGSGVDFVGLNIPSNIFQSLAIIPNATLGLRFTESSLFINNSIHISPNVTLGFGLRYELNSVPTDVNSRIEKALALTDNDISGGQTDIQTQKFLSTFNAQRKLVDGRKKIYNGDYNNFAPRVGIAIDLTGDGKTTVRGGYGLFYDQILGNVVSQSRNIFPAFISVDFGAKAFIGAIPGGRNPAFLTVQDPITNKFKLLLQPGTINTLNFPPQQIAPLLGSLLANDALSFGFTLPDKNLRTPYTHQYSVTLERAILQGEISISYVGTSSKKLLRFRKPNGGPLTLLRFFDTSGAISFNLPRPTPELGSFTIFESSAKSNYNALQVSFVQRHPNPKGSDNFNLQLAYTYSHAIDEVSDIFDLSGAYALAQDELGLKEGLKAERGDANFDVRHRFTAALQYKLPFAKNKKLLGGFQLSSILTLQTGQPYTVNSRLDINKDGNLTDRLDSTNGLILSDSGQTRIKLAPGVSELSLLSQTFQNGSIGRNTFRAAGIASLDLALDKCFSMKNEQNIKLRFEVFNVFNRTHFGLPVRILGTPGFGSSVNTSLPARTVQLAISYQF